MLSSVFWLLDCRRPTAGTSRPGNSRSERSPSARAWFCGPWGPVRTSSA